MKHLLLLLLVVSGCIAQAASSNRTVRKVTIDRGGTTTVEFRVDSNSSSSAPGATSQPTTAEASDDRATAAASGQQSVPLSVYGLEQRQWIFYGGAVALALAGAIAMWRGARVLGYWLFAIASISLLAETFVKVYAIYVVGLLVVAGLAWLIKNYIEDSHSVRSATKLNLEGKHAEATAALRESPSGRGIRKT